MSLPTAVRFTGEGGYDADRSNARRCGLVAGRIYPLISYEVLASSSSVTLGGYRETRFNAVMFEPATDEEETAQDEKDKEAYT